MSQMRAIDPNHERLARDVLAYLRTRGWIAPPSTAYHELFSQADCNVLSRMTDITSLAVRTKSDNAVFHPEHNLSATVEFKTIGARHRNFACEVVPLLLHMKEAESRINCVYPVRRLCDGKEGGFLVQPCMPEVFEIRMPPRGKVDGWVAEFIESNRDARFPNAKIVCRDVCGSASGDPFVLVSGDCFERWPHWVEVFESLIEGRERAAIDNLRFDYLERAAIH